MEHCLNSINHERSLSQEDKIVSGLRLDFMIKILFKGFIHAMIMTKR